MYTNITEYNIEEAKRGRIEELLKEYHQKIYVYCYNILRNKHDAEDATQEVFIKAFRSNRLMEIDNKNAWLYKIAYNHCINKVKRKALIEFIPFTETGQLKRDRLSSDSDSDLELNYILSKLNPKERAMVVLRIVEDKDFSEIAQILDISIPTARKRFERIKLKIQKVIERSECGDE